MAVIRRHEYRIYRDGEFQGLLPYATSDFSLPQQINTLATDIEITIAQSMDTSNEPTEAITTEDGEELTTEVGGETITTERSTELFGDIGSDALIRNNNDIEIWEFSDYDPNGVLVFDGYITNWSVGDAENQSVLRIRAVTHGADNNEYVVGNTEFVLEESQENFSAYFIVGTQAQALTYPSHVFDIVGQSFVGFSPGISSISLLLGCGNPDDGINVTSAVVTVSLYEGDPVGASTFITSGSAKVFEQYPAAVVTQIIFDESVTLNPVGGYFFTVTSDDYVTVMEEPSNVFANGNLYLGTTATGALTVGSGVDDFYFLMYSGTLLTDAIFTAPYDTSDMIREAIILYNSQGGEIQDGGATIDDPGLAIGYTFRLATLAEIIEKCRELSPSGWYYTVDPATQILTFKETATTATHTFLLTKHILGYEVEGDISNVKNVAYFTGGPTAGTNLLKRYANETSIAAGYRRGLARLSDNNIIAANESAAEALSESYLEENGYEIIRAAVVVDSFSYDTDSVNVGDTACLQGFRNFTETLVLQIVDMKRHANNVELILGRLPFRDDTYVQQIKRDLDSVYTLDNPSTPA